MGLFKPQKAGNSMLASIIARIIARGFTVVSNVIDNRVTLEVKDSAGNVIPWVTFTLGKSGKVTDTSVKSYPSKHPAGFDSCHEYVAVYGDEYAHDAKLARKTQLERCNAPVPAPATANPVVEYNPELDPAVQAA